MRKNICALENSVAAACLFNMGHSGGICGGFFGFSLGWGGVICAIVAGDAIRTARDGSAMLTAHWNYICSRCLNLLRFEGNALSRERKSTMGWGGICRMGGQFRAHQLIILSD